MMFSTKDILLERLHGRVIAARFNDIRRSAYLCAIADVNEIMSDNIILSISHNIHFPKKKGDVGYDLVSNDQYTIRTTEVCIVKTGVKLKLPDGVWGMIVARSSAIFTHQVHVMGGIIDNGYTGELTVPCIAVNKQIIITKGTCLGQLVLFSAVTPEIEIVTKLPETERGESGFGSTSQGESQSEKETKVQCGDRYCSDCGNYHLGPC